MIEAAADGAIALLPESAARGLTHVGLRALELPGAPRAAPLLLLRSRREAAATVDANRPAFRQFGAVPAAA